MKKTAIIVLIAAFFIALCPGAAHAATGSGSHGTARGTCYFANMDMPLQVAQGDTLEVLFDCIGNNLAFCGFTSTSASSDDMMEFSSLFPSDTLEINEGAFNLGGQLANIGYSDEIVSETTVPGGELEAFRYDVDEVFYTVRFNTDSISPGSYRFWAIAYNINNVSHYHWIYTDIEIVSAGTALPSDPADIPSTVQEQSTWTDQAVNAARAGAYKIVPLISVDIPGSPGLTATFRKAYSVYFEGDGFKMFMLDPSGYIKFNKDVEMLNGSAEYTLKAGDTVAVSSFNEGLIDLANQHTMFAEYYPGVYSALGNYPVGAIYDLANGTPTDPQDDPPASDTPSSWAADSVNAAIGNNLVPEALQAKYTQAATRAEFCALAVALYENVTGAEITERTEFSDTDDVNVRKAAGIGVVTGVGNNRFDPDAELTREQAATMLARLADALDKPLAESAAAFADNGSIAAWAIDAVGQVQAAEIMGGVGNNTFDPKGAYTREQSIITIMRLFDAVK